MPEKTVAVPLAHWREPASVFAEIAADSPYCFWLDAGQDAADGWSWVGTGEPESDPARVRTVPLGRAEDESGWAAGPFRGGWVGWLGYDAAAARAGAPGAGSHSSAEDAAWLRVASFVAFDHASRRVWAIGSPESAPQLAERLGMDHAAIDPGEPAPTTAVARHSPHEYRVLIDRCREAIRRGDAYQLCLTTRFEVTGDVDPVTAFLRLRARTPTHHSGLVRAGSTALVSASPERFLEVRSGVVRTRPIKGTRPRGTDAVRDAELAAELRASEKERAENVMIVDLMRNDLSRICVSGTVSVEDLLVLESYSAVHQLVSTVAGTLRAEATVGDVLDATFPAGSMTGAPKLSAMTILHGLERAPRGVFAGCFGWVGENGALDLAMVIRSIVTRPGGAYVGAGGGITWRSDAAEEVAEVGIKARGPLAAIGADLPHGW